MIARALILLWALMLGAGPAWAGPPFTTDDPGILGPGEAEVIPYFDMVTARGEDTGEAGFDASMAVAPGIQASLIVPLHTFEGGRDRFAPGDVTVNMKAALAESDGAGVSVALAPAIALPTASTGRAHVGVDLPVWIGASRNDWTFTGGGGLRLDARKDGGSRAFGGLVAHHPLGKRFGLGAEAYGETGNNEAPALAMAGLGLDWALAGRVTLVAAGHAMLANRREHGRFHFYTAVVILP